MDVQRKRILLLIGAVAAFIIVLVGRAVLSVLIQIEPYDYPLIWMVEHIGSGPIMLVTGLLLFAIFYFGMRDRMRNSKQRTSKAERELEQLEARGSGTGLFRTLRWRFLLIFIVSMVITGCLLVIGHAFISYLIFKDPHNPGLKWIINNVGSPILMTISGILLFFIVFYLTTSSMIGYLKQITTGLQEIAKGQLDHSIPVKTTDELGLLAHNINRMSRQLSLSIEEERNAEKAKNDLITGVSHDLRTPLTSILGFLEAIEDDRYKDEVELRYYVNIAHEKSRGLKRLIDDLFEYTKYNNQDELDIRELDLIGFLRQLAEEFVPSLTKADMVCRIDAPDGAMLIAADGESLVRAFENLIANAINYGSQGKYLDIRVSMEDQQAIVAFANYGEPIPKQELPRLFERFYRVEQSRSKHTGGSGLGLAIVKSIVERHQGSISVRSSKKETVFEIRLPLQP
ncbi:two-component sensor histidine kinase [Paenibacillus radicis (ex Gao et al. 2016)]|uniref:histidine kinase n=2 Tax=Paenibacillus radicis (ex Gao et al. 2016) TaxID=1737354 RepID=A0A917HAY0_9BACL|nr:ATP-binding protein [Paenibacillus radicis (ex Gao et al. 2016)]GGG73436.1 two-component sensor histidine kinase [Paenibacillus radicis (ex Gao et al. 2016)]